MTHKILVVDDSEIIRRQIKMVLSKFNYAVVMAEDGVDGLDKLDQHQDTSMIMLDMNMPRMNGPDMLDKVREKKQFDHIPVLIITTEGSMNHVNRAKQAGAVGWLVKPFYPDQLIASVKQVVDSISQPEEPAASST